MSACSSKIEALLIEMLTISVQTFGQILAEPKEKNEGIRNLRKMRYVSILGFCIRLLIKIWSASYHDFDDKRELRTKV